MKTVNDWKTIEKDGLPPVGSCLIVTIKNHVYGGRRELRYPGIIWKRIMLRDTRSI